MDTLTDADIEAWADGFIRKVAFNRPAAIQIAMEAAKFIRSRLSQAAAPSGAALTVLRELRQTLWPSYSLSPEGRAYLAKIDSALAKPSQEPSWDALTADELQTFLDQMAARFRSSNEPNAPTLADVLEQSAAFIRSASQAAAPSGDALTQFRRSKDGVDCSNCGQLWSTHGPGPRYDCNPKALAQLPQEIEATPPQVEPAGWKLVPIEPTREMLDAAFKMLPKAGREGLRLALVRAVAAASKPEAK